MSIKRYVLLVAGLLSVLPATALAQQPGVNSPFNPVFAIPIDNKSNTYGAGVQGLVVASSATDIFTICGAANIVTRIASVGVSGRATAAASVDISLVMRSTANTGGTSSTVSATKYDSTYGTASSSVLSYTVNPTLGTNAGGANAMLSVRQLFLGNLTTGQPGERAIWTFGDRPSSQLALRGTAQCMAVNMNAQTASGNLMDIYVEWTENAN